MLAAPQVEKPVRLPLHLAAALVNPVAVYVFALEDNRQQKE
jgi:hypothetical protein